MKCITICADDFSFSPNISKAILTLLNNQRINATSCMVNTKYWDEHASDLKNISNAKIGLHFALTDVTPITLPCFSLSEIIKASFLRKLKQTEIEKEIHLQIEYFEKHLGRLPDFIDGHQHIHQLPIIRDALLSAYETIFPKKSCEIRIPIAKPKTFKSRIIEHTGAHKLKNLLTQKNIPFKTSFSGVYDFSIQKDFSKTFTQFLKAVEDDGLIMCHPGLSDGKDVIAKAREQEFNYLNSRQFQQDCNNQNVVLTKMTSQPSA